MKNKILYISILIFLLLLNIFQFVWEHMAYRLFTDAVPDEQTALKIGGAVLAAVYYIEPDLKVDYDPKRKIWAVYYTAPEDSLGGSATVVIRKRDGKILYTHLL